jgi:hypothetical protein
MAYQPTIIIFSIMSRLTTTLYDKGDDFDNATVNFPFICSNIPLSLAYGVHISQLKACFAYEDSLKRGPPWGSGLE